MLEVSDISTQLWLLRDRCLLLHNAGPECHCSIRTGGVFRQDHGAAAPARSPMEPPCCSRRDAVQQSLLSAARLEKDLAESSACGHGWRMRALPFMMQRWRGFCARRAPGEREHAPGVQTLKTPMQAASRAERSSRLRLGRGDARAGARACERCSPSARGFGSLGEERHSFSVD